MPHCIESAHAALTELGQSLWAGSLNKAEAMHRQPSLSVCCCVVWMPLVDMETGRQEVLLQARSHCLSLQGTQRPMAGRPTGLQQVGAD